MIGRFGIIFFAVAQSIASSNADEIHWYGSGFVKLGGEAERIPLKEGAPLTWGLRFEVELNDEELSFGQLIPAQLSVATDDQLWVFGNLEDGSTQITVGDRSSRDLVNFAFDRGEKGANYMGPGAEAFRTATFRIHGSSEMVSAETGRALSQARFDWNSRHFQPFIALGFGDDTYLWINLLSLNQGSNTDANPTSKLAETSNTMTLGHASAIRIQTESAVENLQRIVIEYTIDQAHYDTDSNPILETSSDLLNWAQLVEGSYTIKVIQHPDSKETHQYEIVSEEIIEGISDRFFRVHIR